MEMCIKCGVRPAVMYITKSDGNSKPIMEGYCLSCAKELGLAPVDQMFEKFGIGEDEIETINEQMNDMLESMGGPEGLAEAEAQLMNMFPDGDEDSEGGAATAPLSDFMNNIFGGMGNKSSNDNRKDSKDKNNTKQKKNGKKSMLDTYGTDLTAQAALGKVDRVISRNAEIERVVQILNRRTKNNPILLGEPGVGKTAVAEGLAMRIFERNVPPKLFDIRLYLIDFAALVA